MGVLLLSSLCLWQLGSLDHRFQKIPNGLDLKNIASDREEWQSAGELGSVEISPAGVTLKLEEVGDFYAQLAKDFDWNADEQAGATHLLVSGDMQRLSPRADYQKPEDRPSFSVWVMENGVQNGDVILSHPSSSSQTDSFAKLIKPKSDSDELQMFWRLHVPGEWRLGNLNVSSVKESPYYRLLLIALTAQLCCIGLFLLITMFRRLKVWQSIALSAVVAGIIVLAIAAPLSMVQVRSALMTQFPSSAAVKSLLLHFSEIQKVGHVLIFFLLTVVAMQFRRKLLVTRYELLALLLTLALLTEALQRHSAGRSPQLFDMGLDVLGIVIGWIIYRAFAKRRRQVARRKKLADDKVASTQTSNPEYF